MNERELTTNTKTSGKFLHQIRDWFVGWYRVFYPKRKPVVNPADGGFFYWLFKYYFYGLVVVFLHAVAALILIYGEFARTLPEPPDPEVYKLQAPTVTRIIGGDFRPLAELATEYRDWADIEEIPDLLQKAFLAVEDRRFYEHKGIDWRGIARAAWINYRAGGIVQGGSTITQQVAKAWLGAERTLARKIREAILARRIEAGLSKDQILELYLNKIFLGHGAYGVRAAARRYFQKKMKDLNPGEMALIAGLAQAPSRYSPMTNPEQAIRRRNQVLEKMASTGAVTAEDAKKWAVSPLKLSPKENYFRKVSPYFTEQVRRDLIDLLGRRAYMAGRRCDNDSQNKKMDALAARVNCVKDLGEKELYRGGYVVETTIDTTVQATARKHVDEMARWMDKRQGWRGPEAYLRTDEQKKEFRKKASNHYSGRSIESGGNYLALVEDVVDGGALVSIGEKRYTLPLSEMTWAARYTTRDGTTDRAIRRAWRALMVGDVIWVKGAEDDLEDRVRILRDGSVDESPVKQPPADWPSKPYVSLEQTPKVQSAILTIDHDTGYVISMVGGTDFDRSPFNRTTQACRQPGSTYKPIYYSLALDRGWGFDKKIKDTPYAIVDPDTGKKWYVRDFAYNENLRNKFAHVLKDYEVTLEFALVWSKNNASVQVFRAMGANNVKEWARRLGFTTPIIPDDALALGASCTLMHELTRSFGIFARNGKWLDMKTIKRVKDRDGDIVLDKSSYVDPYLQEGEKLDRLAATIALQPKQVIRRETAYNTSRLLRQMVARGHAEPLRMTNIPAAGKTGTSSRTADTWFVGYTSKWLTGAWLGDDEYTRPLGHHDASFNTTLPLWARYMKEAVGEMPLREIPWKKPNGEILHEEGGLEHLKGEMPSYKAPIERMMSRKGRLKAALQYEDGEED